MPGPSIEELFSALSVASVKQTLLDVATSLNLQVTSWQPLGIARTIIATVAQIGANFTEVIAVMIRGGYLQYATGGWLTLLAKNVYGIERADATFAPGFVTLVNASATTYGPFTPGQFHIANPVTGKGYTNAEEFTLNASSTIDALAIVADVAGSSSSSGPGTVTKLVNTLIGVACTNVDPIVGSDGQSDADLRTACLAKLAARSAGGPNDAYNLAAYEAETAEVITRSMTVTNATTGAVSVYVATAAGPPSTADLAIVQTAIQKNAEPQAVDATAYKATEKDVDHEGTLYVTAAPGLTSALAQSNASNALSAYYALVKIGGIHLGGADPGVVPVEAIRSVLMAANPGTVNAVLTTPAADVTMLATDVPVNNSTLFTVVFQ